MSDYELEPCYPGGDYKIGAEVFSDVGESEYDEHFWILYGELLSLTHPQEHSALHKEAVIHCLKSDDPSSACRIIDSTLYSESDSLQISFSDKLEIFKVAADTGALDVLAGLGDMRNEAAKHGIVELGEYLCEEVRVGWNLSNNLDGLGVIYKHKDGSHALSARIKETLGERAAQFWLGGELEELKDLYASVEAEELPLDPFARTLITIIRHEVTLDGITKDKWLSQNLRNESRLLRKSQPGYVGSGNEGVRLERMDRQQRDLFAPLVLYALDQEYRQAVLDGCAQYNRVRETYNSPMFTSGAKLLIDTHFPQLAEKLQREADNELKIWHATFMSLDAKSERKPHSRASVWGSSEAEYQPPQNIRFLRQWVGGEIMDLNGHGHVAVKPSKILQNFSELTRLPFSEDSGSQFEEYTKIIAELDVLMSDAAGRRRVVMVGDILDEVRNNLFANKPLLQLFERASNLRSGTYRLQAQYEIFQYQRAHDADSRDSNLEEMREALGKTINACLRHPIEVMALGGKEAVGQIKADVQE